MNILCKLFGHKVDTGYGAYEGSKYLNVRGGAVDGIDRVHCSLHTECERCGTSFQVGMIHLPIVEDWVADLLKKSRYEPRRTEK